MKVDELVEQLRLEDQSREIKFVHIVYSDRDIFRLSNNRVRSSKRVRAKDDKKTILRGE